MRRVYKRAWLADDDAYSTITPSEAPSAISAATANQRVECGICYERIPDGACQPCGHANFCRLCLANYMKRNKGSKRVCPYCKEPMTHFVKVTLD